MPFGSFRKELFFDTEEEMNKTFGSFTKEQKKEMNNFFFLLSHPHLRSSVIER